MPKPAKRGAAVAFFTHGGAHERRITQAGFEPDSVYAGMNLPSAITAKALQVPLIYLLPIAWTQPYFEHGLGEFPSQYENIFTQLIPQGWKDGALNWLMPRLSVGLGVFNRAAKHFGVKPARNLMDIIRKTEGAANVVSRHLTVKR